MPAEGVSSVRSRTVGTASVTHSGSAPPPANEVGPVDFTDADFVAADFT